MIEALEQSLQALAAEASVQDAADAAGLERLAAACAGWFAGALATQPSLEPLAGQVERVTEALSRGLDAATCLERLQQALENAQLHLAFNGGPARAAAPEAAEPAPADGAFDCPVAPGDREGWNDFLAEGPELLALIEGQLLAALRQERADLGAVLRPLHTLKGICGMLGLAGLNRVMHACEDRLQPFRNGEQLPADEAEAVLAAMDLLRAQLDGIAQGVDKGGFRVLDSGPLEARLASNIAAGLNLASDQLDAAAPVEAVRLADNIIRIPVAKMDALLEAVSELAICQTQVTAGVIAQDLGGPLLAEANRLDKISRQLQELALGLRMVPVQPLFNRISRQAHELSRRVGKPLRVELSGGETEVDKGLVEELFEPLLHLLRNALDHGLDTPEERAAAGKPAEGLLRLSAWHQAGDFVLCLSDDGRGFDLGALERKCRGLGLLHGDDAPAPEWLIDQIFRPGFSTAAQLTDLSGRGVGLDAVRRKVANLKGRVSAEGEPGRGARFTLRLPLTMALMEAILVRTRGERYALPAASVLRFLAWDPASRHAVGGGEGWMEAGGVSLPLVDLGAAREGRAVAMHVSAGGREACLVVDEVLGKQQVVVKSLGGLLQGLAGVGGGAVLADGRVGLILDLDSLLQERALA